MSNAEYQREWQAKNPEAWRKIHEAACKRYCENNPEKRRQTQRDYVRRKRAEILVFFGAKCAQCGFDDPRALHLDHINGGGYKARRDGERQSGQSKLIREDPDRARKIYQLLCANCNCIKREENNEKPGKRS